MKIIIVNNFRGYKRKLLEFLARRHFYGDASRKMNVIGVTGTNGKTTITTLLYKLFTRLGYRAGLIGTIENIIIDEVRPTTHTTPRPIQLNRLLNEMLAKGCQYVFMEVSSHGMDQKRIAGIHFAGGIFTNLTHDHLDYHKNLENYFNAKKKFFDMLPEKSFALANIDDDYGEKILENTKADIYRYGLKKDAVFRERLETQLIGDFNRYNVLAVYAAAVLLGEDKEKVKEILKNLDGAEGRFQSITSADNITGIVDFAHTPDALENVLTTIRTMLKDLERIITVFGCGGGKDPSKRPAMTRIVYEMSDISIPTADNPRNENIERIFEDMRAGLPENLNKEIYFIPDRREAIQKACTIAMSGDYIVVTGKGHEKYQIIKGIKHSFSDLEELKKNFTKR